MPFGHGRRVERAREADDDRVVGLVERRGVAALGRRDVLGAVDQALRPQESDGELRLVAGRPHRDRHRDRVLVGTGRADLQRRFAHDAVGADLERLATHGHDGAGRDVAGRRDARVVHARSVGPGAVGGASLAADAERPARRPRARLPRRRPPGDPRDDRPRTAGRDPSRSASSSMPPIPPASACSRRSTTSRKPSTTSGTSPASATSGRVPRSASSSSAGTRTGPASAGSGSTAGRPSWSPATCRRTPSSDLRDKYPQYATHALESSPMIAIDIERATSWGALDPG